MNFGENPQHDFPKMRGGVNGRLELFRNFIRFGRDRIPLDLTKLKPIRGVGFEFTSD